MKTISRREALRAGASALALALIPAAALAAMPADHPDAELLALEAELRAADDGYHVACVALDRAENAVEFRNEKDQQTAIWPPSVTVSDRWGCRSEDEIASRCQPTDPKGPAPAERDKLIELYRQREANRTEAREQAGLGPLDQSMADATERWEAAREAITGAQAQSFAGLLVKARIVSKDLNDGPACFAEEIVESLVADLERLVGRS